MYLEARRHIPGSLVELHAVGGVLYSPHICPLRSGTGRLVGIHFILYEFTNLRKIHVERSHYTNGDRLKPGL